MARGDVVIANSGYTARSIKSRYGKAESDIATIYRGVDLARFVPGAVAGTASPSCGGAGGSPWGSASSCTRRA